MPALNRVLVMDRMPLTGAVLCELAGSLAAQDGPQHVPDMTALRAALSVRPDVRTLVITELVSDRDTLTDGLVLLEWLALLRQAGRCRVMVCTDITDPLLLRAVTQKVPSVVALRHEPLSVLREAIRLSDVAWPGTMLSPAATLVVEKARDVRLTPRELDWLVTQADGMNLRASAAAMGVSYKTAAGYRRRVAARVGQSLNVWSWRLGQTQIEAGNAAGIPTPRLRRTT